MGKIDDILNLKIKPKEKQVKLVESICMGSIPIKECIDFFVAASDVDKGTCADVLKHVSEKKPEILADYIDILIPYINCQTSRVKWGISETIGNFAHYNSGKVIKAIPYLLKNAVENKENTTVIRWCAAYGLSEITKNNKDSQKNLLPKIKKIAEKEKNNGVKNVYLKAIKEIEK